MFAGDVPLPPSAFDYVPPPSAQLRRRLGFSCHRDFPDDQPCGCMACSACTKVLRDNVGPQITRIKQSGNWGGLSVIDHALQYTDEQMASMSVEELDRIHRRVRDKIRNVFAANGLVAPKIVGAIEFSRETIKENGREVHHFWAPHVHGDIEVSQGVERIAKLLHSEFYRASGPPRPAVIAAITDSAGWIAYYLKDPRDMYRRVHLRWTSQPRSRREASPRSRRTTYSKPRRHPTPKKQPMTSVEAEPLMQLFARIPVQKRLFLMGYQFQGRFQDGRLVERTARAGHQGSGDKGNQMQMGGAIPPRAASDQAESDGLFRMRLI